MPHRAHAADFPRPRIGTLTATSMPSSPRPCSTRSPASKAPTVLVQDYHFALLPRLIKEKRPDARVAIFWHIPWPNPEAFGICPWRARCSKGCWAPI